MSSPSLPAGVTYKLEGKNNYTMHGGGIGYNRVDWTLDSKTSTQAVFRYLSWDGQQVGRQGIWCFESLCGRLPQLSRVELG
jgi:hypothetical protein